jgi:hypothetical protein
MKVYVFFEGKTEEKVVNKVCSGMTVENINAEGKEGLHGKLAAILSPLLQEQQPVACLVLRDLDSHQGETETRIVQGLNGAMRRMFEQCGFQVRPDLQPLAQHQNVFVWTSQQPAMRVALHIATYQWHTDFIKATIDDYVLALALEPTIAGKLTRKIKVAADTVIAKITQELPTLLHANGIKLEEAKDYVRLYAAVIKTHTSPAVFAEKVLEHAQETTIRKHFAALYAALDTWERP